MPNIENNPCLVIKITIARKIYELAKKSIVYPVSKLIPAKDIKNFIEREMKLP